MIDNAIFSVDFDNEILTVGRVYNTIRLIIEPKEENTTAFGMVMTPQIIAKLMGEIKYVGNAHRKGHLINWETDDGENHYQYSINLEPVMKEGVSIHFEAIHNGISNGRTVKASVPKFADFHNKLMAFRAE